MFHLGLSRPFTYSSAALSHSHSDFDLALSRLKSEHLDLHMLQDVADGRQTHLEDVQNTTKTPFETPPERNPKHIGNNIHSKSRTPLKTSKRHLNTHTHTHTLNTSVSSNVKAHRNNPEKTIQTQTRTPKCPQNSFNRHNGTIQQSKHHHRTFHRCC